MTVKKKTTKKKTARKKTTKAPAKRGKGRPSSFSEEKKILAKYLYEHGKTDRQVAEVLEVTTQTIGNWKKQFPDFFASLKEWKELCDGEVEATLYERAMGYSCPETKVFLTKTGEIKEHTVIKHYAPDVTAQIFWLKNRKPKQWRDKVNVEHGSDDGKFKGYAFTLLKTPEEIDEDNKKKEE